MKVDVVMGLREFLLHRSGVGAGTMLGNRMPKRHFLSKEGKDFVVWEEGVNNSHWDPGCSSEAAS